ncbi:MAG: TrkA C-terminal domain-containing protein [Actinomycetota bacterium]
MTLTFTRLATGALLATGMPADAAAFQARSAFSGAGFTTTETENVVNHPVRRRIIATTMFVGSLGTPTLIVSVMVGFIAPGPGSTTERTLVAFSGLLFVVLLLTNRPMTRILTDVGRRYANRRLLPTLSADANEELTLGADHIVATLRIDRHPNNTYRNLAAMSDGLPDVRVLGLRRDRDYFDAAGSDVELDRGDELIVYGTREAIAALGPS